MYISFIRREKKVEKAFASQRASLVSAKETTLKQERTGPSITSRIDAFLASAAAEHGQHTLLSSDNEVLSKATTKTPADKKKSALCSSQLQPNSCPYPSAAEERVRLCTKSPADSTQKTPYDLSKQELGDFVAAWRGFIQKSSVSDVLMQILANGSSTKQKRKLLRLFKQYPAIGILNIAVS
ncbi:hypothetical protein L7F22_064186 [Adiantum nelumboides]|nr:hypothetical protein [Adiantum nelumboides]